MPKVYVPQEPSRWNGKTLTRYIDLTPALEFGEIVICLPANVGFIDASPNIHTLKISMLHFTEEDFLLAVGDPSNIAIASIIAHTQSGGNFRMLRWDREMRRYQPIRISI